MLPTRAAAILHTHPLGLGLNIVTELNSSSWCAEFEELSVTETLELLALSDKFLLQVQ